VTVLSVIYCQWVA